MKKEKVYSKDLEPYLKKHRPYSFLSASNLELAGLVFMLIIFILIANKLTKKKY